MSDLLSRIRGSLLGLATGDALGTTLEFCPPGTFEPITDMIGRGPFDLEPGQWTDDTSMALCLAESLVECNGFDPADQMQRYLRWYRSGYLSSTGTYFDIGNATRNALEEFETRLQGGRVGPDLAYCGSAHPRSAGNGSLMRIAPIALYFRSADQADIARFAALSSKTTHAAPEAVDACRYYAALIALALKGAPKDAILDYASVSSIFVNYPLAPKIHSVAEGSYKTKVAPRDSHRREDEIRGTGYVVESIEAALWCFHTTGNFRDGALAAANLGDDADTTAAIYGQLAGAFYGVGAIPGDWLAKLALRDIIEQLANRLAL